MGFVGQEAQAIGKLLGTKVAINELIAYGEVTTMHLSERTLAVVTYALCGFFKFLLHWYSDGRYWQSYGTQ